MVRVRARRMEWNGMDELVVQMQELVSTKEQTGVEWSG